MKLQQGQLWKKKDQYIRIVERDNLCVQYKLISNLATNEGEHHQAMKKEFCRMLQGAELVHDPGLQPADATEA